MILIDPPLASPVRGGEARFETVPREPCAGDEFRDEIQR